MEKTQALPIPVAVLISTVLHAVNYAANALKDALKDSAYAVAFAAREDESAELCDTVIDERIRV